MYLPSDVEIVKSVLLFSSAVGFIWGGARWYSNKEATITSWATRIETNHLTHIESSVEQSSLKLDKTNDLLHEVITELRVLNSKADKS